MGWAQVIYQLLMLTFGALQPRPVVILCLDLARNPYLLDTMSSAAAHYTVQVNHRKSALPQKPTFPGYSTENVIFCENQLGAGNFF